MVLSKFEELSVQVAHSLDKLCGRFEQAWEAGEEPAIESYLDETEEPERSVLFRELLVTEAERTLRFVRRD